MPYRVTIEIDCPPGFPRPNAYVDESDGFKNPSRFFGNWTFIKDVEGEAEAKALVAKYEKVIEREYHKGLVRYGSWGYSPVETIGELEET